jgi:polysaccharide biosynthesis protein PslG
VMEDAGEGQTKMWLTEFGWTTDNQAKGYEYGKFVSDQQQAQYLVRAFELGKSYPWMGVMFVWNLNFSTITQSSDEKYPWSVLNSDWSPRPAYTALKNMPK